MHLKSLPLLAFIPQTLQSPLRRAAFTSTSSSGTWDAPTFVDSTRSSSPFSTSPRPHDESHSSAAGVYQAPLFVQKPHANAHCQPPHTMKPVHISGSGQSIVRGGYIIVSGSGNVIINGDSLLEMSGSATVTLNGRGNVRKSGSGTLTVNGDCDLEVTGSGQVFVSGSGRVRCSGSGRVMFKGTAWAEVSGSCVVLQECED